MNTQSEHSLRKHSDFSASGAERWFNCPGSVSLSRGIPDKERESAKEGTRAHEMLETMLTHFKKGEEKYAQAVHLKLDHSTLQMLKLVQGAAKFISETFRRASSESELLVEERISLSFVHEDAFGTFDAAIIDFFDTLHVFDFKFGVHHVSPGTPENPNLQLIYYALGLANKYDYNFSKARLWIIQPRASGYYGPTFLDIKMADLRDYEFIFKMAARRAIREPENYKEGAWCFFCKAKGKCPLKTTKRREEARKVFSAVS